MHAQRTGVILITIALSGCLFGGGGGNSNAADDTGNGTEDTGGQVDDVATPDATGAVDSATPDAGEPPDMVVSSDSGPGEDLSAVDAGGEDMAIPETPPWVVVRRFDVDLGGQASSASPLDVSWLGDGFIVGYRDGGQNAARIAWYTADQGEPLANHSFVADHGGVSVLGGRDRATAAGHSTMSLTTVAISAPTAANWMTTDLEDVSTTQTYTDHALFAESSFRYLALQHRYGSPSMGIFVVNAATAETGYATEMRPLELTNVAAVGGGANSGLRAFIAGVATDYVMLDATHDGTNWTNTLLECGPTAPNAAGGGRIVPLRGGWAVAIMPSGNGPRPVVVRCTENGATDAIPLGVFGNVSVPDIAVAMEDLVDGGDFGVSWVTDTGAWFGTVFFDRVAQSVTFDSPWRLPETANADRVRVAYNPDRTQWGVAVTKPDGGDLYIIERNPALP